jgi:cytochrome bd-type quinol oxidase subunit 2
MRSTEERVAAVKRRTKEMQRQKQMHRRCILGISSVAACLLFIVGLSLAMPGIMADLQDAVYTYSGVAASIFDGSSGFGYVLIGLLAFVLGVSVTILSYHIHQRNQRSREDAESSDD